MNYRKLSCFSLLFTAFFAHASILVSADEFQKCPSGEGPIAFAKLGPIYKVGSLYWSSPAPQKMNHYSAEKYCQELGEGSHLPTQEEADRLKKALGEGSSDGYQPDLMARLRGTAFWTSATKVEENRPLALFIFGTDGFEDWMVRKNNISVRCVSP